MMRRAISFLTIWISVILLAAFVVNRALLTQQKPFYVGVTFCGDNTQDAKLLVDRVKNYTNLFVLQSGPLMDNTTAVLEIGDYAVSNGLHFAAYFNTLTPPQMATWIGLAEQQWGDMFAGLYYGDEPGGIMLDDNVDFEADFSEGGTWEAVTKHSGGDVSVMANGTTTVYHPDGEVSVMKYEMNFANFGASIAQPLGNITFYYPNGTITFEEIGGDLFTMENGSGYISQVEPYTQVLARHPFPSCDAVADAFVSLNRKLLEHLTDQWLTNKSFPVFTSDYALHWFDYLAGYDLVLAQLGWNNTLAQEIGLVRGAANLQGKSWGAIITWTYTEPPYIADGETIFDQMRAAYESGAEYLVVFNYAKGMDSLYGILQPEHFDALERFWNDVVQNPEVKHGGIKAEAAFVLRANYGWGMRNTQGTGGGTDRVGDTVWGLWSPDEQAQQSWTLLQDALAKHGLRLDIVYEDPQYSVAGRYRQIYYWNQTS